ncbi:hypothetical protein SADUNF_Sadunf17G0069600 [Salix dunnii]|uniref:Uncharacterized protein n=1 Tax=Salix dunnii TaxID=1413687 RepID=A0A835J4Y3_9ROSI|nr:hypothetical protein SADUNF_Sadunf17G0069600 [Salix dunnii]
MAFALQRSSVSFRRQGSSGRVWENLQVNSTRSRELVGTPAGRSQEISLGNTNMEEKSRGQEFRGEEASTRRSSYDPPTHSTEKHKDESSDGGTGRKRRRWIGMECLSPSCIHYVSRVVTALAASKPKGRMHITKVNHPRIDEETSICIEVFQRS